MVSLTVLVHGERFTYLFPDRADAHVWYYGNRNWMVTRLADNG